MPNDLASYRGFLLPDRRTVTVTIITKLKSPPLSHHPFHESSTFIPGLSIPPSVRTPRFTIPSRIAAFLLGSLLCILPGRAPANGFPLALNNANTWGQQPFDLIATVETALNDSGIIEAAELAEDIAADIAAGKVPAVEDLADVVEGDIKNRVDMAIHQATLATDLLASIDLDDLKQLYNTLQGTIGEEVAFSIPNGRAVFRPGNNDPTGPGPSLCVVVAHAGGVRVTMGMSGGGQLCRNPHPRFANPTKDPVVFVDLAAGYSHLQVRKELFPAVPVVGASSPLPTIEATTYFQLNGQWLELRLAGADPASLTVTMEFVLGVNAGISYLGEGEIEGQIKLGVAVKPAVVDQMLREITQIIVARVGSTPPSELSLSPAIATPIIKEILDYLKAAKDTGKEIGEVSLAAVVDGGVGVGIWDTGIKGVSVAGSLEISVPIEAMVSLSATSLELLIDSMTENSEQMGILLEAVATGKLTDAVLQAELARLQTNTTELANGLLTASVAFIQDIDLTLEMTLNALGEKGGVADETIPLLVMTADIPVGKILVKGVQGIPEFVNGITETAQAVAWAAKAVIGSTNGRSLGTILDPASLVTTTPPPPAPPTAEEWESMAAELLDDVTLSINIAGIIKVSDISLGNYVRLAAGAGTVTTSILAGLVESGLTLNDKPLLDALRAAPGLVADEALQLLIFNLQTISISTAPKIGANGTLGAEVSGNVGASIGFEARVKASLLLLLLDNVNYNETHETLLAGIDIPVSVSASAGVSIGEGVEFNAEGGFTVAGSLASLTLKHWEEELPSPAGLEVAGFEVIDFVGVSRQDGTIEGSGWLVLPQGGLVRADSFALDAGGNVVSGTWSGVLELGPFGEIDLLGGSGQITNDGLTGRFAYAISPPFGLGSLQVDFRLRSNGLLFGNASGSLDFGGIVTSNTSLTLLETGFFSGSTQFQLGGATYNGNLTILVAGMPFTELKGTAVIGGVSADLELVLSGSGANGSVTVDILGKPVEFFVFTDEDGYLNGSTTANLQAPWGDSLFTEFTLDRTGVHGSGMIRILGSEFHATNLRVQPNGRLTGTFSGSLSAGGIVLPVSSLEIADDRLQGLTTIDIAGHTAVELMLSVDQLGVTGRFVNDLELFGAGKSEAWLRITDRVNNPIEVYGFLDLALINQLDTLLTDALLAGISDTRKVLSEAAGKLAELEGSLAQFDAGLVALEEELRVEMKAAKADAEALVAQLQQGVTDANNDLNDAVNALIGISGGLADELRRKEEAFRVAATALDLQRAEVEKTTREIARVDAWYNGLDLGGKIFWALGYGISRQVLLDYRAVVQISVDAAQLTYNGAWAALQAIQNELSNATALIAIRDEKDALLQQAQAAFNDAQAALETIVDYIANPKLHPRYLAALAGREAIVLFINGVEDLIAVADTVLGGVAGFIQFIDANGPEPVVTIHSVLFRSTLEQLNGGVAEITVDATVWQSRRSFTIPFNFKTGDNLANMTAAMSLLPADLQPNLAWRTFPWTDDASAGLSADRTLWAYHFNSNGTTSVTDVPVVGLPGVLPAVGGRFSIQGMNAPFPGDQNELTAGDGGSAAVASNFIYNGNPGSVTFEGLIPGTTYVASFFSVGFDLNATRLNTFSSSAGSLSIDQNTYGNNKGIRIDHTFTATAATHTVTIQPAATSTFHLYALALSVQGTAELTFDSWNAGALGTGTLDPGTGGKLADADGDGISNLMEYALRTDPLSPNPPAFVLPTPINPADPADGMQISFPYQPGARDLIYRLQHSANLGSWTDAYQLNLATGVSTNLPGVNVSADSSARTIGATISNPALLGTSGFWRLVAETP